MVVLPKSDRRLGIRDRLYCTTNYKSVSTTAVTNGRHEDAHCAFSQYSRVGHVTVLAG